MSEGLFSLVGVAADVRAGYRLAHLEVLNWGTFDEQVWRLTPGCQTAGSPVTSAPGSRRSSTP
jgi:uncharacterized protein YPO0396